MSRLNVEELSWNWTELHRRLSNRDCSFKEVVDAYKNSYENSNIDYRTKLSVLLHVKDLFAKLIHDDLLSKDDMNHLISNLEINPDILSFFGHGRLEDGTAMPSLFEHTVRCGLFVDFVDVCDRIQQREIARDPCGATVHSACALSVCCQSSEFAQCLEQHLLKAQEVHQLLERLSLQQELVGLASNSRVWKQLLSQFFIYDAFVEKYREFLLSTEYFSSQNIKTVFDYVRTSSQSNSKLMDDELLFLNDSTDWMFSQLNAESRSKLFHLVQDNTERQDQVFQLFRSGLESVLVRDVEELETYLLKSQRKSLLSV